MRRFAELFDALDQTTSTSAKVEAMAGYFASAPAEDAAWAVWFLSGRKLKRLIASGPLRQWAMEAAGVPEWLFEECHIATGDLAETIALLLDGPARDEAEDVPLHAWVEQRLLPLRGLGPDAQKPLVIGWWRALPTRERFLLDKLLTGGFRVGVSDVLVARALADVARVEPATMAHRLMGAWQPDAESFRRLMGAAGDASDPSRPYPFYLASPLESPPESLGDRDAWLAEWKWDGIRAQLIRRAGATWIWSRGEELITDRFPELREAAAALPDGVVLDGEVLAMRDGRPLPFAVLQRRIGRRTLTAKVLSEAPAGFLAFDLLEADGADVRETPLAERRARLEALLARVPARLAISPALDAPSWVALAEARTGSRERGVEGVMLKRLDAPYRAGRRRGEWWKWKIEPYTVDAVMVYAQAGHGRRADLHTDYTFAVWKGEELVPVARAYSGLTDPEILELDRWIRRHTTERFGPVRAVEPVHVFELAFEGIAASPRHKSGVALRFPRIVRRRTDKQPRDADTLDTLRRLLGATP